MATLFGTAPQSLPELYEKWLVTPLFRPWAELALDDLGLGPTDRVLDVACGTGIVARVAKERLGASARVVGVDLSPNMLAIARRVAPGIDWREGNAAALPLQDGESFNAVICQQGLQFVQDKPAAVREMKRALTPRGRLAISTWRPVQEVLFVLELQRVAERRLGAIQDVRHGLGDAAELERLLRQAGFDQVQVKQQSRTIRFDDGAIFARLNAMALVGMSAARNMPEDEKGRMIDAIVSDSAGVLRSYAEGSGLAFEIGTNFATAAV